MLGQCGNKPWHCMDHDPVPNITSSSIKCPWNTGYNLPFCKLQLNYPTDVTSNNTWRHWIEGQSPVHDKEQSLQVHNPINQWCILFPRKHVNSTWKFRVQWIPFYKQLMHVRHLPFWTSHCLLVSWMLPFPDVVLPNQQTRIIDLLTYHHQTSCCQTIPPRYQVILLQTLSLLLVGPMDSFLLHHSL